MHNYSLTALYGQWQLYKAIRLLTLERLAANINTRMDKSTKSPTKFNLIRHVPSWIFLALFLFCASISVYALRHNNTTMVKLRDAVYATDRNNGDVNTALNNLRSYVYGHMNTSLSSGNNGIKPPIQLKYTYERLQAASQDESTNTNSQLYTEAENYCQAQIPANLSVSGRARVPCVQDYVTTHGASIGSIPAALYEFDFVSPTWSPDLAGWSLVFSCIFLVLFLASFTVDKLIKAKLRPL
jgi:hypothetical protein